MLTNWKTISISIKRLKDLDEQLETETQGLTKKELLNLTRERDKLERALGGIREMGGLPDILFVIDTNKEQLAIQEANKLGIPIVAILDSNCDPTIADWFVPMNDDSVSGLRLILNAFENSINIGQAKFNELQLAKEAKR
jgi:small subunit ribosomal protein S2